MTSALRGAAMRAVLMFHTNILRDKVTRQCPQTTTFEVKAEADSNEVPLLQYQPTRLTARPHRLMDQRYYSKARLELAVPVV